MYRRNQALQRINQRRETLSPNDAHFCQPFDRRSRRRSSWTPQDAVIITGPHGRSSQGHSPAETRRPSVTVSGSGRKLSLTTSVSNPNFSQLSNSNSRHSSRNSLDGHSHSSENKIYDEIARNMAESVGKRRRSVVNDNDSPHFGKPSCTSTF